MERPKSDVRRLRWITPALAFAAMMTLALSSAGAQPARRTGGRRRMMRPTIRPGTEAPDFELPRLTLEKGANGKVVGKISKEKVKLSSFRGKKVVCIFSSSYT